MVERARRNDGTAEVRRQACRSRDATASTPPSRNAEKLGNDRRLLEKPERGCTAHGEEIMASVDHAGNAPRGNRRAGFAA
jgi:hypothetical protein